jgi:hypothetical protein
VGLWLVGLVVVGCLAGVLGLLGGRLVLCRVELVLLVWHWLLVLLVLLRLLVLLVWGGLLVVLVVHWLLLLLVGWLLGVWLGCGGVHLGLLWLVCRGLLLVGLRLWRLRVELGLLAAVPVGLIRVLARDGWLLALGLVLVHLVLLLSLGSVVVGLAWVRAHRARWLSLVAGLVCLVCVLVHLSEVGVWCVVVSVFWSGGLFLVLGGLFVLVQL